MFRGARRLGWMREIFAAIDPKLSRVHPAQRASLFQRSAIEVAWGLNLAIERTGQLPPSPAVLVANHVSWLDPIVVAALTPCAVIAKSEIERWPLVGERCGSLGVIFVDRLSTASGASALRQARRAIESGVSVLNFPEGTTSRGNVVYPFRRGIFGLARALRVPVVPVRIELPPELTWAGADAFLPHLLRCCASEGARVRLHFGAPLPHQPGLPPAWNAEQARLRVLRPFLNPHVKGHDATALSPRLRSQRSAHVLPLAHRRSRAE
jgi:1-acyl-sn-glycerol-3-phosphate acyltransferase